MVILFLYVSRWKKWPGQPMQTWRHSFTDKDNPINILFADMCNYFSQLILIIKSVRHKVSLTVVYIQGYE